ncbi:MAG: type IV pilus secretin PilQ [Deltaproteobacteria bacterium]|nr:type IV pilus secretin PilQ [Deltaproteobacteria bacterium]MBW2070532.1 type IV pilus secretin PilQ [Deltaproteobacteria bacterium]
MMHAPDYLKRGSFICIGLLALVLCAQSCATPSHTQPAAKEGVEKPVAAAVTPMELEDIRLDRTDTTLDMVLVGSAALSYTAFKALDPPRLIIDLPATTLGNIASPLPVVDNEVVSSIKPTVLNQDPLPMTRVEVGLKKEIPYDIVQYDNEIRVSFALEAAAAEAQPEVEVYPPEPAVAESTAQQEAAPPPAVQTSAPLGEASKIVAVKPFTEGQTVKVYLVADGRLPAYTSFPLLKPPRLVLDLKGIKAAVGRNSLPVDSPLVNKIRLGNYPDKARVVFDLVPAAGVPYSITPADDRLVVTFEPGPGFASRAMAATAQQPEAAKPAVAVAKPARIESIDFRLLDSGTSRLSVRADRVVSPVIQVTSDKSLSLVLPDSVLPDYLQRYIDTGQFASAVNLINPRPVADKPNMVALDVRLREMVPYQLSLPGKEIYLDFAPSAVPPPAPIKLGKPVTVVEARTPAAAAPAAETPKKAAAPSAVAAGRMEIQKTAPPAAPAAQGSPPVVQVRSLDKKYTGEKISLDLQDVDVANVLRLLADVTGKNMVIDPSVKGKVTLKVERVPWDQVLDLVLKINGLDKVAEGNVILVATSEKIKKQREAKVAAIKAEQERLAAARDLGEITTEYLQVNYASAEDVAGQIDKIRSEEGRISVDERTNLIIYSDYPKRIENARDLIAQLDRPTPQVMIESRIVEASTNFSRDLGIDWNASYTINSLTNRLGAPQVIDAAVSAPVASIGTLGVNFTRMGTNLFELDLRLSALESEGEVRLISSPRIFTLDNVKASIQQGEQIPYPQQSEDGISTAFVAATLSLDVTPHITPDDQVRMEVKAKNDFADFSRTVNGVPAINTREATTELMVGSGNTVVIGGIVKQDRSWTEDRVPFLAKIPGLSWLFKSRLVSDNKTELLIFLSPTIVRGDRFSTEAAR